MSLEGALVRIPFCHSSAVGGLDTAIVDLVKSGGPAWPRLETDTHLMSIGSGRPLEEAWRASQVDMIAWMGEHTGWTASTPTSY